MKELERLKIALDNAHSAVYEWNVHNDSVEWIGNVCSVLSINTDDDAKKIHSMEEYSSLIHKLDREKHLTSIETSLSHGGSFNNTYRICLLDNTVVSVRDRGAVITSNDKKIFVGTITSSDNCVKPIKNTAAVSKKETHLSPSTFYSGSEYFDKDFMKHLAATFEEGLKTQKDSVLLKISIDNLPMMMTWYSLDFADRIMEALEIHLATVLRKDCKISRISLDQFGVILKNHSESETELVIDRILKRIQLYNNPSFEETIHMRSSVGSVYFPSCATNPEDALNKSYLALCTSKGSLSDFYCDYKDAKREHMDNRDQMGQLNYLQDAFREDRMHLAYQPLVMAKTGKVNSYECLLRVEDEDGNLDSAGHLIPIAEKMGTIDMVDQYVMERIINEIRQYKNINLAFNVSNMTTSNPKWLKMCTKLLQDTSVASRIVVEITETAAQRDMRQTAYFVAALQALGCRVALDDFGAGYTSFRQLKSLSVDIVKIDGTYVLGLEENSENLLFIKTLLEFNHSYGVQTVAECVETGEVAKILMDLKVDYLQGYYFGKADVARPWAGERPSYEIEK